MDEEDRLMAEYWRKIIREDLDDFRTYISNPAIFQRINLIGENNVVLDAGCGEGYLSRYISEKNNEVVGIDISPRRVQLAKKYSDTEMYQVASIYELPFDDCHFDVIICNFVLIELEDLEKALIELKRVLKNDGKIIVQHLNPNYILFTEGVEYSKEDVTKYRQKFVVSGYESPYSTVWFNHSKQKYYDLFKLIGLQIDFESYPKPAHEIPKSSDIYSFRDEKWCWLFELKKE